MRRSIIAATAAVAGFAALCSIFTGHKPDEQNSNAGSSDASAQAGRASGGPGTVGGLVSRFYRFTRRLKARMGDRDLVEFRLRGRLGVYAKSGSPAQPLRAVAWVDTLETRDGRMDGLPAVRVEGISGGLDAAKFTVAKSTATAENVKAVARFTRDLLDQFLFFEKRDLQGRYEALITKLDATHYRKKKSRYLDAPYSNGKILSSRHVLETVPTGESERIEGSETLSLGTDKLAVRSESSYAIEHDPALTNAFEARLAGVVWNDSPTDYADHPSRARRGLASDARALEGIPTLDELLRQLRRGKFADGDARMAWFRNAIMRINAEGGRLDSVRAAMPEVRANPEQFTLLVGALASASQKDASSELLDTYRDDQYTAEERAVVMRAWAAADVPLQDGTLRYLMQLASDGGASPDQAQGALLALGAQVLKLGGGSPDQSSQIEALLIGKLQQAQSNLDIAAALDAMGNSGTPDFLPYIQPYLSSPVASVRAHAYLALRLIPGPDVAAMINAGQSDPSSEVQDSVELALNLRASL